MDEQDIDTPRDAVTKLADTDFLLVFNEASQCSMFSEWWKTAGKKSFLRWAKNQLAPEKDPM